MELRFKSDLNLSSSVLSFCVKPATLYAMVKQYLKRVDGWLFGMALVFVLYMPLHVFIAQSVSLVTGGLEVWKALKDIVIFLAAPSLISIAWRCGLFKKTAVRRLAIPVIVYVLLHGLFLLLHEDDPEYSAVVGVVYNTRFILYLLLGYLVGMSDIGKQLLKYLLTATVVIASFVALFGVVQYFLPHDFLSHFGYSIERGVMPLFFIDNKADLPRVMSTLKDPNSFGAYLIIPILLTALALFKPELKKQLFVALRFSKFTLIGMLAVQLTALLMTFSRGAVLALIISACVMLVIYEGKIVLAILRRHVAVFGVLIALFTVCLVMVRNTYVVQNVIFHADESTVLADPNELRVSQAQEAVDRIYDKPLGYGPGTAGLVSINNSEETFLTENYYLQIAYEVGWLGLAAFVLILVLIACYLGGFARRDAAAAVLLSALAGYAFYSLFIHLWSNEAIALSWWLLSGVTLGVHAALPKQSISSK